MNTELFTEPTIQGHKYRINKLLARDGSYVLQQLMRKLLPGTGTRQEFNEVQDILLNACHRYAEGAPLPVPILIPPDRWAFEDLKYDTVGVASLTAQALVFNMKPFFDSGGLSDLTKAFQTLIPPTPGESTGS